MIHIGMKSRLAENMIVPGKVNCGKASESHAGNASGRPAGRKGRQEIDITLVVLEQHFRDS